MRGGECDGFVGCEAARCDVRDGEDVTEMHRVLTPRAGGVGGSGAMGERMREAFCARAALSALSRSKDPRCASVLSCASLHADRSITGRLVLPE